MLLLRQFNRLRHHHTLIPNFNVIVDFFLLLLVLVRVHYIPCAIGTYTSPPFTFVFIFIYPSRQMVSSGRSRNTMNAMRCDAMQC
ncbi:uncharacterized protein F4822DRAFT_199517 [Hypoxylon trugodes]|uniref:uncharacterized protein n=1 Tax=Hypoxylon trugodes TaxID=326681 RepID=UPI00219800D0|nr:uncharacterized protein F4822DRAFT_199517 [Hypoxylon trugodes]KAI1389411.1 hypothetical protein F4822DRAFT_199517 [Hypoxylon trugodes]